MVDETQEELLASEQDSWLLAKKGAKRNGATSSGDWSQGDTSLTLVSGCREISGETLLAGSGRPYVRMYVLPGPRFGKRFEGPQHKSTITDELRSLCG